MKKVTAAITALSLLVTACSCSGGEPAQTAAPQSETQQTTEVQADKQSSDTEAAESTSDTDSEPDDNTVSGANFRMSVRGSDGKMSITRGKNKSTSMGSPDTWTIFVYLCGTDLESSGQGSATSDVMQMLDAQGSDNVKFVFQTGGTSEWMNETFSADTAERYVVQHGKIELVDSVALKSMGSPDTLSDFLNWGIQNYPAEKMGVVFWNHGGGSISGACFDELNSDDSLSLAEINTGFSKVYPNMTDKFEFIGFDCCLMGTIETANILATYARYFYGSQESEPGTGWDYTTFGTFLAQNPSANGGELGKVISDSFYAECEESRHENECTFTIIDLEKLDELVIAFNDYAKELYEASDSNLSGIVRGVSNADNFGGNNKSEGYTNMVDLGGIIDECSAYADGSAVKKALKDCIVYNINGKDHKKASGLSIYYPLQLQGSSELTTFSGVCVSPYYLSLVDRVAKGYSDNGYTNEVFFTEDGDWSCEDCSADYVEDTYFDDYTEGGGESSLIHFTIEPTMTDEGSYGFQLTADSLDNTSSVSAFIYYDIDGGEAVEIGETYDVIADWNQGLFVDNFDGYWLALPDRQILATYIVGCDDDCMVYTSPILLNGKETNLRLRVYSDYSVVIDGAWDGIDECGAASREIKKLKSGDVIVPLYYTDSDDGDMYEGDEYKYSEGDSIIYDELYEGDYEYCFQIEDVYGDYYYTDFADFGIDEEGNITFG